MNIHCEEIIAIRIGTHIYFGEAAIENVLETQQCDELYARGFFYLMASFDLSPIWKEWADNAPTLFLKSELKKYE